MAISTCQSITLLTTLTNSKSDSTLHNFLSWRRNRWSILNLSTQLQPGTYCTTTRSKQLTLSVALSKQKNHKTLKVTGFLQQKTAGKRRRTHAYPATNPTGIASLTLSGGLWSHEGRRIQDKVLREFRLERLHNRTWGDCTNRGIISGRPWHLR